MHLSTSNSDEAARKNRASRRWVVFLLLFIALFLGTVELMSRFVFPRTSGIAQRMDREFSAARSIGRGGSHDKGLLLVGNSLLGASVEPDCLRQSMPAGWDLAYLQVEDTSYMDWYFGLRRLFAEGARPQVVAVLLSPTQTVVTQVRGEFFAHYLMRLDDVPAVARSLNLRLTSDTGMVAGNISQFYGVRAEIRKWLLLSLMPDFQTVASTLTRHPRHQVDDNAIRSVASGRLQQMNELVSQHNARLVWILPVLSEVPDGSTGVLEAARPAGVQVLIPIPSGSLPANDYRDGLHLSEPGRKKYTAALIPLLEQYLTRPELAQAHP
jgi:hypothetical protein